MDKYNKEIRKTHKMIAKVGDMRIWERKSKGSAIQKTLNKHK